MFSVIVNIHAQQTDSDRQPTHRQSERTKQNIQSFCFGEVRAKSNTEQKPPTRFGRPSEKSGESTAKYKVINLYRRLAIRSEAVERVC